MAGQSPWVINAGISYSNKELGKKENKIGIDVGVFYNVKGPTLYIVGSGIFPDVYTDPFHGLNFGLNVAFGKDQKMSIDFNAENLIGDFVYHYYTSYNAQDQTFQKMLPGRKFSIGFKYRFK